MSLIEKLTTPPTRGLLVEDCVQLVDAEVKKKGGLSGMAIKGAYALVKAIKPTFVAEVTDLLLDDWMKNLEPIHEDWLQANRTPGLAAYLTSRRADVAERLLAVTDGRAQHAKSGSVRKAYDKLRPTAKKHVEEAVPGLGAIVEARYPAA